MPSIQEQKPRKPRKDTGVKRIPKGSEDKTYAFRLSPAIRAEAEIIDAIEEHKALNPGDNMRDIIVKFLGGSLNRGVTREERVVETLEQQIDRLASSIDRLLTLKLEHVSEKPQQEDDANGVNMDYLKRIQQTLRGGKK
jgi:hypothetical protein